MRSLAPWLVVFLALACHPAAPPPVCEGLCTPPSLHTLDLLAGQPGGPGWVDGAGAAAHFADPYALTGDGQGQLYLADGETLRKIDLASAQVTTLAGAFGVVGGTDGVGAMASFNSPSGLSVTAGALWLTDTENHTLRKMDLASAAVSTVAGVYGSPGTTDAVGAAALFREPEGLVLASDGNFYIGDTDNNTIRKMSPSTLAVSTVAGTAGITGTTDDIGAAARFTKPKGLTADGAGNVYIIDSSNQTLRKMVLANYAVSTLATFNTLPAALAIDGTDVIVSLGDHTIVRVASVGGAVTLLAGTSNASGFVDGVGAAARFTRPAGLYNDGAGSLYVADGGNYALRKIALATGTVSTFAGASSIGSSDGVGAAAHFWAPQGMVADASGSLYVADTNNDTIRKVTLADGTVSTIAGSAGQVGSSDGAGAATDARFNQPGGLALDEAAQVLYIVDTGNRSVRALDLAAGTISTLGFDPADGGMFTNFSSPAAVALDGGRLYVTDYLDHTIVALDPVAKTAAVLAGKTGLSGPSDGPGEEARFYSPTGIVADGRGNLFVADVLNSSIRKVVITTGEVTTFAGTLDVQGTDDGVGTAARFAYPTQLTVDGLGNLFVSDSLNNTVRHIDLATAAVTTVVGTAKDSGVAFGPLPAQLTDPLALALTPAGTLVISSESALVVAH